MLFDTTARQCRIEPNLRGCVAEILLSDLDRQDSFAHCDTSAPMLQSNSMFAWIGAAIAIEQQVGVYEATRHRNDPLGRRT